MTDLSRAPADINEAVVVAIADSAIPRVDTSKLVEKYGADGGQYLAGQVQGLVHEAVSMPIEWGSMSLAEGVRDILGRFSELHPELSQEALREIGRCVGWSWR